MRGDDKNERRTTEEEETDRRVVVVGEEREELRQRVDMGLMTRVCVTNGIRQLGARP